MTSVRVATDFSRHPAGRHLSDGPYSGEAFRQRFLEPKLKLNEPVELDLDGTRGYGSSFLEEAFGGLVRLGFGEDRLKQLLVLNTKSPSLKQEIAEYIQRASAVAST